MENSFETSIDLINEIETLGKGIFKITVEYYCTKTDNLKRDIANFNSLSGKMAIKALKTSFLNSGADKECIEILDYFYTETTTVKHTVESVTKKVSTPKETKAVLSKGELEEIEE